MKVVRVAITSDLACPWCWIGLRKLRRAEKQLHDANKLDAIEITWKPYLLRPDTPQEGTLKDGSTPESRVPLRLKRAGRDVGIDFTGLTDRTPNTVLFHAVLHYLQQQLPQGIASSDAVTAFHEAVFEYYFTLGKFPGDAGTLVEAAYSLRREYPQVHDKVRELLLDDDHNDDSSRYKLEQLQDEVRREAYEASRSGGIDGVPSFAFGDEKRPSFSGAQPTEVFVRYLERHVVEVGEKER